MILVRMKPRARARLRARLRFLPVKFSGTKQQFGFANWFEFTGPVLGVLGGSGRVDDRWCVGRRLEEITRARTGARTRVPPGD